MRSSYRIVTLHLGFALALSLTLNALGSSNSTRAQEPARTPSEDRDRGIQLYQKGDPKGAAEILQATVKQDKEDKDAWHYLGLALLGVGDKSGARKAFEKAATLRIDDLYRFNYTGPPKTDEERKARWQATLARLDSALDSVEHYVALTPKPGSEWRTRLDNLRKDKEYYEKAPNTGIFSAKDVTTKARIVSKPEPAYTEEARRHDEVGTVILRAVFAFDGTVRNIVVFRGLKYGLNERAVEAARKIKFIPATRDGHPVSMYMQLEYNFNLY